MGAYNTAAGWNYPPSWLGKSAKAFAQVNLAIIHVFGCSEKKDVDAHDKRGHDVRDYSPVVTVLS